MKILIYGVGGIGGYLGCFFQHQKIDLTFIARGDRLNFLKKEGLILRSNNGNRLIKKINVKEKVDPNDKYDFIISTVKLYDFDNFLNEILLLKDRNFIIIPFQNGVYSEQKAELIFGEKKVSSGVAQISSYINKKNEIVHVGKLATFFVGTSNLQVQKKLKDLCEICSLNSLDLRLKENIYEKVWQKFIFLSAYSGMTTAFNKTIGQIFENKVLKLKFITAMRETFSIAEQKKICFREDPIEFWLRKINSMPFEMTSSMHEDSKKNKKLELQWLSGFVVEQCKSLDLKYTTHQEIIRIIEEN